MSGSNHIVGGVVFTGIYLSMWDLNIFSQPAFLFFTAFFSVLPDIDHTKAPIGKMFYPLAKYLDRNYGHRTITHSLLCYFVLFLCVGMIEKIVSGKSTITAIFIWSYGSHLIADMITKQGVPLFYPFKKNPCVIPANPDFRLRSSDIKTEAIVFIIFIFIGFSCRDLFANGFWNTYNKSFNNLKHIANEAKIYDGIININYEIKQDGITKKGSGIIIEATNENLILFNKGFLQIDNKDRIIKLNPLRQKGNLIKKELQFENVIGDSLRSILKDKIIIKLKAQSEIQIHYNKENLPVTASTLDLEYVFNPVFKSKNVDSVDKQIEQQINMINEEIANNYANKENEKLQEIEKEDHKKAAELLLQQLEKDVNSEDLYVKEQALKKLPHARLEFNQFQKSSVKPIKSNSINIRMNYLKSRLHIRKLNSITGFVTYVEITK